MKGKIKKHISSYLMVVPVLLLFTVMIIVPAIDGFRISLTDWDGVFSTPNYIGFSNYKKFFTDPSFSNSLWITIKMAVLTVVLQNVLGLFTALMLQRDTKLNTALRALFFIPTLLIRELQFVPSTPLSQPATDFTYNLC